MYPILSGCPPERTPVCSYGGFFRDHERFDERYRAEIRYFPGIRQMNVADHLETGPLNILAVHFTVQFMDALVAPSDLAPTRVASMNLLHICRSGGSAESDSRGISEQEIAG